MHVPKIPGLKFPSTSVCMRMTVFEHEEFTLWGILQLIFIKYLGSPLGISNFEMIILNFYAIYHDKINTKSRTQYDYNYDIVERQLLHTMQIYLI